MQSGIPISWNDAEPGWQTFVAEVLRLYRRSRRRPLLLLCVLFLSTALGFYNGYKWQPVYEARVALRLTENDVGVTVAPRPIGALRTFVTDVALSDRVLERIMQRFDLYAQKRARGLDQAIEALREDIGVEVWRNEFLVDDENDSVGRSARVAFLYSHKDPKVAWSVVEAMAEATIAEQRRVRRAQAEYLAMGLEPAIESAERRLRELRLRLGRPADPTPLGTARRLALVADFEELEARRSELSERRNEAILRLRLESLNLGLQSEIIDSVRPEARPYHQQATMLGALLGFLCGLLLGSVTLKAFDRHIYDEDDVLRLGFAVCGSLPVYPGDGVGSMNSRVRMTAR